MPIFMVASTLSAQRRWRSGDSTESRGDPVHVKNCSENGVFAQTNGTANRFGCGQEGRCSVKVNESADQTLTLSCLCTIRGCMVFRDDAKPANISLVGAMPLKVPAWCVQYNHVGVLDFMEPST